MNTASTTGPDQIDSTGQGRSVLQSAAAGAVAATLVNAAIWAVGRAADVSFVANAPTENTTMKVGIGLVVLATLGAFGMGWGLLTLATRRSGRWVRAVLVTAAVVSVVSVGGPLSTAQDTATGVLLAAMHLLTGAAFLVTASRVRAR